VAYASTQWVISLILNLIYLTFLYKRFEIFAVVVAVLGIGLRVSCLQDNHSTTWAIPLVLLLLVCFSERVLSFCPDWVQTMILLRLHPELLVLQMCNITLGPEIMFFCWYWGFNSGIWACEAGSLPLELCLQSTEIIFNTMFNTLEWNLAVEQLGVRLNQGS
jgi:hypothetical protein